MFIGHPQRPLSAHAGAHQADAWRPAAPALSDVRDDVFDDMPLGGQLGIELFTDSVGPPASFAQRRDHRKSITVELFAEGGLVEKPLLMHPVQIDEHIAVGIGLIASRRINVARMAGDRLLGPCSFDC